jgi:O-antigen ligase
VLDAMESTPEQAIPEDRRSRALALTIAALFIGTVAAVDPYGLVPSGPARWTVTTVLTGLAVVVLLRESVRVDRVTGALWAALIGWLFLAALFAVDTRYAWIGTPDRRLGWIAWCTFPLLFVCGQALRGERDRRLVLRGAAIAAAMLGVWCVCERLGSSLIDESFAGHRVGGPFGQPAYVGAAAVLLLPLAAGLACDREEPRWWRGVAVAGVIGSFAALVLAQTRGAWFGFLVAGALWGLRRGGVLRRRWRECALGFGAVVVLFAVTPLGGRFASAFDLEHGTTRGRFDDWAVGARVVEHHPVLGVGPEGYRVVFPQVVSAGYVRRYGTDVIPDRAHNGIIDVAADGGVVAGVLYAALLAMLVAVAWSALRARDPLVVALAVAVVAYVVQQLFLFPLSELDPLFWIAAGMLVAASRPARTFTVRVPVVVPLVVAACVVFGAVMGTREIVADRLLERAAKAPGTTQLRDADRATRLRPDSIRTWYVAARIAARGPALTDVDAAITRVERGLRDAPRDPALRGLDADLLVERAVRSGLDDDRTRARTVVDADLVDAPLDPALWSDRAAVARLDGDGATEATARARAESLRKEKS